MSLITVNNGPSAATNVSVQDLLPSGYTYLSSNAPVGTTYDNTTGVWNIGNLANGTSSNLTITATVNASGNYTNSATISGTENDPTPTNSTSTITPTPIATTDLSVSKTVDNTSPAVGSNVIFTLTTINNGPSAASNVSVQDLLPSGYTYVSSNAPVGTTYNSTTGLWKCTSRNDI